MHLFNIYPKKMDSGTQTEPEGSFRFIEKKRKKKRNANMHYKHTEGERENDH